VAQPCGADLLIVDDLSVSADKDTLTPEDFAKVRDLKLRPMQFCIS
jgi:hypothetical protein